MNIKTVDETVDEALNIDECQVLDWADGTRKFIFPWSNSAELYS